MHLAAWFAAAHAYRVATAWAYHSLVDPGNLLAGLIGASVAGLGIHRTLWRRHIAPHLRRVEELHHHLDPSHPFTLGGESDGESSSGRRLPQHPAG